jgi:hypothetical protein
MTIYTLRPSADVSWYNVNQAGGTATRSALMADNNAGTGAQHYFPGLSYTRSYLSALPALATGENIVRARIRLQYSTGSGNTDFRAALQSSAVAQATNDYYTANVSGATATFTGAWQTIAPDGGPWTAAKVADMRLSLEDSGAGSTKPFVAEAYVDVETNFLPAVTITAPVSGSTITDTMQPTVSANYSDAEGDPMDAFEVRVFTSNQFGVAGFNPDASGAQWASGQVAATAGVVMKTGSLVNGTTHRAYVRFRQAGIISQWSPWAYTEFTISVTPPATPTLTVAPDAPNARNILTYQDYQNMLSADDASFEGSIGGWSPVANPTPLCTVARIAYGTGDGDYAMDMAATAAGTMQAASSMVVCQAGKTYSAQAHFFGVSTSRQCRVDFAFYSSGLSVTLIRTFTGTATINSGNVIGYFSMPAPENAFFVQVIVSVIGVNSGEHFYVDNVSVVPDLATPFPWTRGGLKGSARAEIQRTLDGGLSWEPMTRLYVFGSGTIDPAGFDYSDASQAMTLYDYEAPRGIYAEYRARVNATVGASLITSPWTPVVGVFTQGAGWWLKSLNDSTFNFQPNIHSTNWEVKSTERQGVFHPLGRSGAVVISDVIGGEEGTLTLAFLDQTSFDNFEGMRRRRETVLLESPYGARLYVRFGADRSASFMLNAGGTAKRIVTIPFVEVSP